VQTQKLLPRWDGKPIAVSEAASLEQSLALADGQSSMIVRRVSGVLNFVSSRGSANALDDHMRTLSDNDAIALDGSYALNRFMIWAMPILGFLGTVLGITEAISGITPEQMENNPGAVSNGLIKAFDATALALSLTLISMFFNFLVEKLEQGLLERVDHYVDAELAHRFVRTAANEVGAGSPALQQLVETQISLWSASMEKAEQRWLRDGPKHLEQYAAALHQSLDAALTRFGQRIVETEKKLFDRQQVLVESVGKIAKTMNDNNQSHQLALARLTDAICLSVEMISKVQSSEAQMIQLQETLSQNLALLANSTTFEQAVESLTAAIHLLTTRVTPAHGATASRAA
jgi:biopolymer transport protein ExbB/TolQ